MLEVVLLACAEGVIVEPREWDFGVRPPDHLITKVIRLRPVGPEAAVRVTRARASCECLTLEILRADGTPDSPAEIRAVMDTDGFRDRFRKSIFIALGAPRRTEIVFPVAGWIRAKKGPGAAEVFFAGAEPSGERFLDWWRKAVGSREEAGRVKLFPMERIENYKRLRGLERRNRFRRPAADVVAFVDGEIVLRGEGEVKAGLTGFLDLESDGQPNPTPGRRYREAALVDSAAPAPVEESAPPGALEVWLFYFSDCPGCTKALEAMRCAERERGEAVKLTVFDTVREPQSVPLVFAMAGLYPDAPEVLPSMIAFVGDELLLGTDEVASCASKLIAEQLRRGRGHLRVRKPEDVPSLAERPAAVALLPVLLAGLADGVNPCAFAAMVLLVAVLSAGAASSRRELLLGGGAFCAGVFCTYYLAGLALFAGARELRGFPAAEAAVFWAVWALAVLGGCLSAWDAAVYYRTGDPDRVRLKVPESVRRSFAPLLRGRFTRWGLVLGGFGGGVIIAVLEGVCTGQMYLPAIQYMARTPGLRAEGAAYLLLYNALFVLPLVGILLVAAAGVRFQRLSGLLRRHLAAAKLALAAVFFLLAAGMIIER